MGSTRVAIVTGASSGIGRATALELGRRGYRVALAARRTDELERTRELIEREGGTALSIRCDVSSSADVDALTASVVDSCGRIDVVIANAGIEVLGDVIQTSEQDWRRCIDVNLTGTFLLAKSTIPALLQQTESAFIAIASDLGITGAQDFAAYTASKHGIVGLIRCMALDYGGRGLRSNAVCPSLVVTNMFDRIMGEGSESEAALWAEMIPAGRFAQPEEVARAVAHLAGSEASYTNGIVYSLDGGATAGYYSPKSDPARRTSA